MIIDDLIKSALEANNADTLEKHWTWFTDTMLSRLEEGGKIIVVMTRWHSLDLAGRIIETYGDKVKVVQYKAVQCCVLKYYHASLMKPKEKQWVLILQKQTISRTLLI